MVGGGRWVDPDVGKQYMATISGIRAHGRRGYPYLLRSWNFKLDATTELIKILKKKRQNQT